MTHGLPGGIPGGIFTLADNEQIITVDGFSGMGIGSLMFTTSKGNKYGPWGSNGDRPFRLEGPVYGFYGANTGTWLSAIGIWTRPSATPPPPRSPPPPPPFSGRIQSPVFGDQSKLSGTWDDDALSTGCCSSRATFGNMGGGVPGATRQLFAHQMSYGGHCLYYSNQEKRVMMPWLLTCLGHI
jgi:hypothetical protein